MKLKDSELILNDDGSIYHLNLKPENISNDLIFVGDPDRVDKVTQHFDTIEFSTHKREFKTTTGTYKNKRISVISTGIGADNIDIVLNELDALVNINLQTRTIKKNHTSLNIIRIGTSGSLQKNIPVDSFLMSTYAIDINGMLRSYPTENISHPEIENAFVKHTQWDEKKSYPLVITNSKLLESKINSDIIFKGMTATAGGFYGPQGRVLRIPIKDSELNHKMNSFIHNNMRVTNYEMETSAIYGLSKLLGHNACSMNVIIANRSTGNFSANPSKAVENLIIYTLNKMSS
ncbi:nucleoside phosphorylase [Flavobacteriaceae bacterium]|nr:nucleoside phosphorylase [Flavobacteriaceae bacterium]MDB2632924.1 nucleoside phosphorylase [Flavobacteriaceae bacterium]MDC0636739.1 nucleoside phosphorylase [Flavobacteriaceae bacterium]